MPGLSTENLGCSGRILGEARCLPVGQGIRGMPGSSLKTTLVPRGAFGVPAPPEPRPLSLRPVRCFRVAAALLPLPPLRPPLPGTFLGTSGWPGPPGRVELPQEEGEQDTPPTSPGQNFPAPPHASSCHRFAYSLCACLLRTHSGPSHRQPEPKASVPVFQHLGGPLPLSWGLGTPLGTRPTWSLVPAPWLRFDR